jgi:hypothetical protein
MCVAPLFQTTIAAEICGHCQPASQRAGLRRGRLPAAGLSRANRAVYTYPSFTNSRRLHEECGLECVCSVLLRLTLRHRLLQIHSRMLSSHVCYGHARNTSRERFDQSRLDARQGTLSAGWLDVMAAANHLLDQYCFLFPAPATHSR